MNIKYVKEDIVSFELAKLLKEKGFDGEVYMYYMNDDDKTLINHAYDCTNWNHFESNKIKDFYHERYSAPTVYEAQKWFEDKHDIHISINKRKGVGWDGIIRRVNKDGDYLQVYNRLNVVSYNTTLVDCIKASLKLI